MSSAPKASEPIGCSSSIILAPIRAARQVIVETRPRIAHGTECLWWGAITDARVESTPAGDRFRCPHCGGQAESHHTEESFLALARRFEIIGFPRHQALIRWTKGRCFKTRGEAWGAFAASGVVL